MNIDLVLMLDLQKVISDWNNRPKEEFVFSVKGEQGEETKVRALSAVMFSLRFIEPTPIMRRVKFFSKISTFYIYDVRVGYWVAMSLKEFEKSMQQIVNAIRHLKGHISPAVFTKTLVNELTGTEIHVVGLPEPDMNHLCLRNCIVNTTSGARIGHTPKVFLTAGVKHS